MLERAVLASLVPNVRDALTGRPRRPYLTGAVEAALRRARRTQTAVGLLILDLDELQPVNDRFGRAAGDAVLRAVGTQLRSHIRSGDLVTRAGGDEFAVLLPDTSEEGARLVGERLIRALNRQPVDLVGHAYRIGSSVGAAVALPWASTVTGEALFAAADQAMSLAKRAGKCRVAVRSLIGEAERRILDAVREQSFRTFLVRRNRVTARRVAAADDRRGSRMCLQRLARRFGWLNREQAVRLAQTQRREGKSFIEAAAGPDGLEQRQLWTLIACRQDPPEFLARRLVRTGILSVADAESELAAYYDRIGARTAEPEAPREGESEQIMDDRGHRKS